MADRPHHPLVRGFRIARTLEHIIRTAASDDTRALASRVLHDGDTDALYPLNDALQEEQHPIWGRHRWADAARGLHTDAAVREAVDRIASRGHVPFHVVAALNTFLNREQPVDPDQPLHALAVDALATLRRHVPHDELQKSIHRNRLRIVDAGMVALNPTYDDRLQAETLDPDSVVSKVASKNEQEATLYARRVVRKPVHEMIRGTRLAVALKRLAKDADPTIRGLALPVLRDGDLNSLAVLADLFDVNNGGERADHPLAGAYDWRGAARRLPMDKAVWDALDREVTSLNYRTGTPHSPDLHLIGIKNGARYSLRALQRYSSPDEVPSNDRDAHSVVTAAQAALPDATHDEIRRSLHRARLKAVDSLEMLHDPARDRAWRRRDRQLIRDAAITPDHQPVNINSYHTEVDSDPEVALAARYKFRRDPLLTAAFNAEFNKVADRLHAKQGVADIEEFKKRDHFGRLLAMTGGDEQLATDTATRLLYDGVLERGHKPGQPLGPLIGVAGRYSTRKAETEKSRQLGGPTFTDATPPDQPSPDVAPDRSAFRTDIRVRSQTKSARDKAAFRDRLKKADDKEIGRRILSLLARHPEGLTPHQVHRLSVGIPVERILAAAKEAGAVVGSRRTKTHTQKLLLPPGSTPPSDPKEELYQKILKAVNGGRGYKDIAADHGLTHNQVNGIVQRLRKAAKKQPDKFARSEVSADFLSALRRVRSRQQAVLRKVAAEIHRKLRLEPTVVRDAVHDTDLGSLANTAQSVRHGDRDKVRLAAAQYGLLSQTPSMVHFEVGDGPDFVHRLDAGGSGERLRAELDRHGVGQRLMVPTRDGWRVLVYDAGGKSRSAVARFAAAVGGKLRSVRGRGELIGGGDGLTADGKSRRSYRAIIREMEEQTRNGDLRKPATAGDQRAGAPAPTDAPVAAAAAAYPAAAAATPVATYRR